VDSVEDHTEKKHVNRKTWKMGGKIVDAPLKTEKQRRRGNYRGRGGKTKKKKRLAAIKREKS